MTTITSLWENAKNTLQGIWSGICQIASGAFEMLKNVILSVSAKWLKILTEFKQQEKITVGYFDTETLTVKTAEMYVEGYKAVLVKDTSMRGL